MYDLLRANGLKAYGGRPLAPGEEFIAEARYTPALLKMGLVIVVQSDVDPPELPALLKKPRKTRHYKTRHLTAS